MRAEILSVGTELLLGQILDTNARYLATMLAGLGIDLHYKTTVGDNADRLEQAIRLACERADLILTIGGLGPTEDDLTKETIATVFEEKLALHEPSAEHIRGFFKKRGLPIAQSNLKQALIYEHGLPLENDVGTAPGCLLEKDGKVVISMPGPPNELTHMVERHVLPYLSEKVSGERSVIVSRVLRLIDIGESAAEARVLDLLHTTNPTVAPLAHIGEAHLRITAKAADEAAARVLIAEAEAQLRERLGDHVYGVDNETLEVAVLEILKARRLTLALAESCTGGLLASRLTDVPGSSEALLAGVVAYSNETKTRLMGVPGGMLAQYGAVSEPVACALAEGARRVGAADIGIGITGIAGPGGGTPEKPVGLVYTALAYEQGAEAIEHHFIGGRLDIRRRAAQVALAQLRRHLLRG
ncbi:MAG: competence/damage-inducible protein A [Armatimonadetes bacterium]|nr:competence/damage-inducible protein A [Armatimonadota bacterium]